jgi:predicted ATPase
MSAISPPYLRSITTNRPSSCSDGYPFNIGLFRQASFSLDFFKPLTILSGENGSGKSTLLEMIAENCGFNLIGGNANHSIESRSDVSELVNVTRFSWSVRVKQGFFLRAESLFNFASYLEDISIEAGDVAFAPYGGKSLHNQSHGEAFLSVLRNRLSAKRVYILDEPEAALSPMGQLQFMSILSDVLSQNKAQIILATHSPILLSYPNADILELADGKIVRRAYKDTQNFQLYARFLARPEKFHQELLVQS